MSEDDIDYRADRMESPDGHRYARAAWETYKKASNRLLGPALNPVVKKYAAGQVTDLFGFWLIWQLEGGYDGMIRIGMSRSSVYRRIKLFRRAFGMHPDEAVFPGVAIDVEAFRSGKLTKREAL